MQILTKTVLIVAIVLVATAIAKRLPSTAGLMSVMPLVGALTLVLVYLENRGNPQTVQSFAKGSLFGIIPTALFFLTAFLCFRKNLSLPFTLSSSFAVWLCGALVHQWILR